MEQLLEILANINDTVDFENAEAIIDDELIESVELMELISEIEDAFDITVEMEDMVPENFNTVEAMWEMITRLQDN